MTRKSLLFLCGIPLAAAIALTVVRPLNLPLSTSQQAAEQATAEKSAATPQREPNTSEKLEFEAARAFALLQAQCDFGPRPPGSAAHDQCRDFLIEQLQPLVDNKEVVRQDWTQSIKSGPGAGRSFKMTNILGMIRGAADKGRAAKDVRPALMLCAHW